MNSFGGILAAIFLLIIGVLLITGILNFLLWILGAVCIVLGIIVGAMALFGGRKNSF
ncbi:MAG: magnesium transporter accessory protein [Chloroflexi bacterium]|nr:magnesium transporter accessory protein [Chloroflexota bacterium]